jgi:hypothetical protein
MHRILALLVALFVLTACASSRQIYTNDGSVGHAINCSGTIRDWSMCYEKAGELCQSSGYEIISRNESTGYVVSDFYTGTTYGRQLVIQCR